MNQKDYWNNAAESKEFTTKIQIAELEKYVDKKAFVLDVGCGYGRTLNELHEAGFTNTLGIDFSEKMIKRGIKMFPELNLKVKKSAAIDLEANSVDAVILFAVLTCIVENKEQTYLIDEIKRILKPNGIIYINDFLLNEDERNIRRYEQFRNKYGSYGIFELQEGALLRHHEENWIKELLKDFNILEYHNLIHKTMNGHVSKGFYYIGNKKARLSN
ncbi:methyltransferase domain-containing protein [Clostridium sp. 19966]|uniref:class I SAM-dependent methyltransferase n=1 Tax=Clostridium sp. 19966 TaxID=2768166 RepID=UPI0028E06F8D|nr:class I SAM-dependent methyltransferase [Clostridium sp. 19966]MDT8715388.1 methyltransferase domain-containing protein [Clostridium sp. 19966]